MSAHGWAVVRQRYDGHRPDGDPEVLHAAPSARAARAWRAAYLEEVLRCSQVDGLDRRVLPKGGSLVVGVWDAGKLNYRALERLTVEDRRERRGRPRYAVEVRGELAVKTHTRKEALKELTREVERWRSSRYPKRTAIKNPVLPDTYDLRTRGTWTGVARVVTLGGKR